MIAYAEQIDLFAPLFPAFGQASLSDAIATLQADPKPQNFIAQYDVPSDLAAQQKWLQAAFTIRPSDDLPNQLTDSITTINHLRDCIALEFFCKSVSGHSVLLASKITKQGVYKSRGLSHAET